MHRKSRPATYHPYATDHRHGSFGGAGGYASHMTKERAQLHVATWRCDWYLETHEVIEPLSRERMERCEAVELSLQLCRFHRV